LDEAGELGEAAVPLMPLMDSLRAIVGLRWTKRASSGRLLCL